MTKYDHLKFVAKNIERNALYMKTEVGVGASYDVDFRDLIVLGRKVQLYYINGLVDDPTIVELIKKLVETNDFESETDKIYDIIKNRLVNQQVDPHNEIEVLTDELLNGLVIVFVDGEREAFVIDVRKYPGRQPEEPDTERVIRGSRDGFTENMVENTGLIRRRIKDRRLRNEIIHVGVRSKTDVCLCYIDDIVNDDFITILKEKMSQINIDGLVMADKALDEFLVEQHWNPYPLVRYTERPDVSAHHILSGYVILVVDTSPSVIILPTTFFDHLEHAEEYRQTPAVGTMTRWIRILAVLTSMLLLPVWLMFALEPSLLPRSLSFIGPEKVGNVPLALQIIIADIGVEFMRMAAVHTPTPLATALGLIAAVLIGDIAIDVGLFTPEVILYVAISTIGTYVTPSYELSVANKFIKIILTFAVILFGKTGFVVVLTICLLYLIQLKVLRTPYFWPLIPFDGVAFTRFLFRIPVPFVRCRPSIVHPKDRIRQTVKE